MAAGGDLSALSMMTSASIWLLRPARSRASKRRCQTPLASSPGSRVASGSVWSIAIARLSCSASVDQSSVPTGASSRCQLINWAADRSAAIASGASTRSAARLAVMPVSAPLQAMRGAAESAGSSTGSAWIRWALKPSWSVAVTRSSISPGFSGVKRKRPAASNATGRQGSASSLRVSTVRSAMPLHACARALAITNCPGLADRSGVVDTTMSGGFAAALAKTRTTKLCSPRAFSSGRPSATATVSRWSPIWPGPGVQRSSRLWLS
ncbi:MAG: hypothetical protein AW07_04176 [Candidatus Accumulibacter sp. SK-11]|nr:MAG: hypothetical protein AW07_04176 [Candidatus Accumulibacter sp. SK-11]